MIEEQFKEIALLAEELGFIPNSYCTNFIFKDLLDPSERDSDFNEYYTTNLECYLLLCEIQLWLLEKFEVSIVIQNVLKHNYSCHIYRKRGLTPDVRFTCSKDYREVLSRGVLEGLILIKNENN